MNSQVEEKAEQYAKERFRRQGYLIEEGFEGCDFVAKNGTVKIPVEVKGRSNGNPSCLSLTIAQLQLLKNDRDARLALVAVNGLLSVQMTMELYSGQDIIREEPESYFVCFEKKTASKGSQS